MVGTSFTRLAVGICAALCGAAQAATVQHFEPLRAYRTALADDGAAAKPAVSGPTTISFNAFSRDFTLELEPNGRLARFQARSGGSAYRGKIAGNPESWVRVVLTPSGPTGLVFDGETLYGLESGVDAMAATDGAPAMFRLDDVYFAPGELGHGTDAVAIDGNQAVAALVQEFPALEAAGATLNLDLGVVADFEFSQSFGSNAETALLTRVNNIDGLFSAQLGVQISVGELDIFTASNDPFTSTTAANTLLDEVANYRGATPSQDAQGLTHLFTTRNLDGSTAGVAFLGALCARRQQGNTRSFGSGLSESTRGAVVDSLVAAHEIGHNFGAPHDGDSGSACASTPTTFLMAPSINGSSTFSTCSIQQMQPEIASASCLAPIGAANVTVSLAQPTQNPLVGVSFTQGATVSNTGADAAAGVTFTAAAEQGLQIVAAEAGGATCTVAATSVSCAIGASGGGAARNVTLTLRAASAGTFDLTATVDADVDDDAGDNVDAIAVTGVPSVDLVLSGSSPGVQLNAQASIQVSLANTTDLGATSVAVAATLSAGLRPDHATLGGTACTITGQSIACSRSTLAAQANVPLVVLATAVAAGAQQLTINASASEAEQTPANNQLMVAVTVNEPASDGGGGALSWLSVMFLLAAQAWRSRAGDERRRRSLPTPSAS